MSPGILVENAAVKFAETMDITMAQNAFVKTILSEITVKNCLEVVRKTQTASKI